LTKEAADDFAGVFLVDKPVGITSFAVVRKLRWLLRLKKVGHAGTLDPFASGLLVLCAGRPATRLVGALMAGDKEYLARLRLGVETDTFDNEGEVVRRQPVGTISASRVEESLARFRGDQYQVPPAYSALKHRGKPLYHYARQGIAVVKEARPVSITLLQRCDDGGGLDGDEADLDLRVVCSKGTYIRSLAADIGRDLGCGAHLVQLRRTRSGPFQVDRALTWEELNDESARERCRERAIAVSEISKLLQ
jgi:tRNA pseudouridine55 synthase